MTRTGSGCCRCCRARRRRASACRRCVCCCFSEPAAAARGGRLGCLGAVTKVFHMCVFWSLILKFPQKGTQGSTFPCCCRRLKSQKACPCRPHDRHTSLCVAVGKPRRLAAPPRRGYGVAGEPLSCQGSGTPLSYLSRARCDFQTDQGTPLQKRRNLGGSLGPVRRKGGHRVSR